MYKNLDKRRIAHRRVRALATARNRAFLSAFKEALPCVDCKTFYPSYAMDLDHLRDKTDAIARFKACSLNRLKEEIAKCELVCSNCHRIRTYSRRGFKTSLPL